MSGSSFFLFASMIVAALMTAAAFMPVVPPSARMVTSLQPKFLKDLGFEKPSWLPDFGKKEETPAPEAEEDSTEESEETTAETTEE